MALRHMKLLCICAVFVTASLVEGQCEDAVKEIVEGSGEILSPNYDSGTEYGKKANCTWSFSPNNGNDFALVLTVKQLRLFVVKSSATHCLSSYNLTLNNEQIKCDRFTNEKTNGGTGNVPPPFCKVYYSSPTCANLSQILNCESRQETSYPVSMTYFSDGRTENGTVFKSPKMYFKIAHQFIECPGGEESTTTKPVTSTEDSTAATVIPTTTGLTPSSTAELGYTASTTIGGEKSITTRAPTTELAPNSTTGLGYTASTTIGDTEAFPASISTVTIAMIAVVVFLLVGGVIGGIYLHRRLKSSSSGRSQRQQSISQDNPLPGEEDQPTNAIPDVSFHNYEEIQPPALIETPGYEFPQRTGMVEEDEGGYVVPNVFQQGESSREAEYEEAFQYPEPDYIEPETVRKEPNRRHVTKFKNPQKDRDLPTTSDGYLAFGKNN